MPLITKKQAESMGIKKTSLQTIIIPKSDFTVSKAKEWLKKHGYLWQYYRTQANTYRFAQTYDIKDATFYSKKLPNDIVLVFQTM
jgi:hypothetical protein